MVSVSRKITTTEAVICIQSNLDYPDLDYPDYSITQTFFFGPNFLWKLISCDLENWKSQKVQ